MYLWRLKRHDCCERECVLPDEGAKEGSKAGHEAAIDFAAVIAVAAESILITTSDLDAPGPAIVYVNPAFERMTGWSSAEVLGKSPRLLQGPQTDLRIFSELRDKIQQGQMWEGCALNYRKDGSPFWMEWSIVPLRNDAGLVQYCVAVQRDVSARIEGAQRLQAAEAAERAAERARANLARYFSPKLVEALAAKDRPLGGVRRQNLAVLFADVVGFTELSEALEPEQVIELLREIHSWMEKAIFGCDGSIKAYIGDAVLAIFGFPGPSPRDASNALRSARALLAAAAAWNQDRVARSLAPVKIGIGLHYGPVVLGDVGTEDFVEFTVIGDTVNIASRLEQATRGLQCDLVVSQGLVDAVKDDPRPDIVAAALEPLRRRVALTLRGRKEPVGIWTL